MTLGAVAAVQSRMKDAKSFQLPSKQGGRDPEEAPRFEDIKLIDYDFKTYGEPPSARNCSSAGIARSAPTRTE